MIYLLIMTPVFMNELQIEYYTALGKLSKHM